MHVPHALEFPNERLLPARLRRQFAGPRPVAVSADLLKSAGHRESLWPKRRYRSLHLHWHQPRRLPLVEFCTRLLLAAVVGAEGV